MKSTLVKLFKISRPISWVNTAYPFAAGYLVLGGEINLFFWLAALFFLIPYNLMMYGINDVFDYESDIRNPRKGSIEGAVEAKTFHPTILKAVAFTSLPFIFALVWLSSASAALVLLGVVFFVIAYSAKGLRFKEIPFLDSITSSLHFTGPLVFAIAATGFNPSAWPFVIGMFIWGLASHAFGAVQDIIPDRKAGIRSIATALGAKRTIQLSLLLYAAASMIISVQPGLAVIVGMTGLIYVLNLLPYTQVTDRTSAKTNQGWRRFIWLNYLSGAVITIVLIVQLF